MITKTKALNILVNIKNKFVYKMASKIRKIFDAIFPPGMFTRDFYRAKHPWEGINEPLRKYNFTTLNDPTATIEIVQKRGGVKFKDVTPESTINFIRELKILGVSLGMVALSFGFGVLTENLSQINEFYYKTEAAFQSSFLEDKYDLYYSHLQNPLKERISDFLRAFQKQELNFAFVSSERPPVITKEQKELFANLGLVPSQRYIDIRFEDAKSPIESFAYESSRYYLYRPDPVQLKWKRRNSGVGGVSVKRHPAVDLATYPGVRVSVYSTLEGIVSFSGNFGGWGKYVEIIHGETEVAFSEENKVIVDYRDLRKNINTKIEFFNSDTVIKGMIGTCYAHLRERFVEESDYVKAGQEIGIVGMTGHATGPHLHYGIFVSTPVDTVISGVRYNEKRYWLNPDYFYEDVLIDPKIDNGIPDGFPGFVTEPSQMQSKVNSLLNGYDYALRSKRLTEERRIALELGRDSLEKEINSLRWENFKWRYEDDSLYLYDVSAGESVSTYLPLSGINTVYKSKIQIQDEMLFIGRILNTRNDKILDKIYWSFYGY